MKPRLLFIGDSPTTETGFGRVVENVLPPLTDHFDVTLLGINYYNEKHNYPFEILPASGPNLEHLRTEPFGGEKVLNETFMRVQPNVVVALNDIWVLNSYSRILAPYRETYGTVFLGYFPVDGAPYHKSLVQEAQHNWNGVATYTEFGKRTLIEAGMSENRITIIPHGTNTTDFFSMPRAQAREKLNLPQDIFLVFNGNRNQPRKRYDLMVKGFARFLRGKPSHKVGLFAHGGLRPSNGWNVPALLEREMQKHGVNTNQKVLYQYTSKPYPHNMVSKATLNLMYNAADVGINTCMGEGWGLVNTEHALTGVPQIVPQHSSLAELFGDSRGILMPIDHWETERPYLLERGIVSPKSVERALQFVYDNPKESAKRGKDASKFLSQKNLTWDSVAKRFVQWVRTASGL